MCPSTAHTHTLICHSIYRISHYLRFPSPVPPPAGAPDEGRGDNVRTITLRSELADAEQSDGTRDMTDDRSPRAQRSWHR